MISLCNVDSIHTINIYFRQCCDIFFCLQKTNDPNLEKPEVGRVEIRPNPEYAT